MSITNKNNTLKKRKKNNRFNTYIVSLKEEWVRVDPDMRRRTNKQKKKNLFHLCLQQIKYGSGKVKRIREKESERGSKCK